MSLLTILEDIKANELKAGQHDVQTTLEFMLENIGHPDGHVRDELIYNIVGSWVIDDVLTLEQKDLVKTSVLNNLSYNIGESGEDSVFVRTFSVLQIPVILYAHSKTKFLSNQDIQLIYNITLEYLEKERDLRGYISGKGWAHAVAHTADALKFIAREELTLSQYHQMLVSIQKKMSIDDYVYIDNEDERMVSAVMEIIKRVEESVIIEWLASFKLVEKKKIIPNDYHQQNNIKNFVRSLYFRLEEGNIKTTLKAIIDELNTFK
jgi:hypothetical protein